MKRCSRCKQSKPLAAFAGKKKLDAYCKICKATSAIEYRRKLEGLPVEAIADRLWAKVNKTDTCWLWTGAIKKQDGYGVLWVGGKLKRVHRIVWELAGRELPKWPNVLDHTCKVRHCCRLEHLRAVTQGVNSTENSESPHAKNGRKTHCTVCGGPYSGENLAIIAGRQHGKRKPARACLTCNPRVWMWAVIERAPPPGARLKWRGAFKGETT